MKYSPLALIGGFLGLASFFIGVLAGLPALVFCALGIIQIKKNDKYKGEGLCTFGIIMSIVSIIFYASRF